MNSMLFTLFLFTYYLFIDNANFLSLQTTLASLFSFPFHQPNIEKFEHINTRMKTFIKAKLNKSDGKMNIDNYRVAAHTIFKISCNIKRIIYHVRSFHEKKIERGRTPFPF